MNVCTVALQITYNQVFLSLATNLLQGRQAAYTRRKISRQQTKVVQHACSILSVIQILTFKQKTQILNKSF